MKTISLLFFEIIHITALCITTLIKEKPLDLCWQIITNWFFWSLILGMALKTFTFPNPPLPNCLPPLKASYDFFFLACILLKNYYYGELFRCAEPQGYIKERPSTKARIEMNWIMAKENAVGTECLNTHWYICPLCSSNTKVQYKSGVVNKWTKNILK